jgi:hypothetical protein
MPLSRYLREILRPHVAAGNAITVVRQKLDRVRQRRRDRRRPTYRPERNCPGPLQNYLCTVPAEWLEPHAAALAGVCQHYLEHRFDLLGSGWMVVRHGMTCRSVEGHHYDMGRPVVADAAGDWLRGRVNPANLAQARRIWQLVAPPYTPIDWHIDFKTGHRWRESRWYQDIAWGHRSGVDVKVPAELARMQHLPQLVWAYVLAQRGHPDFAEPTSYVAEFRNQVLDFMATNPPRFGVNWHGTMDVAIRAANWLLARDLFLAHGVQFDEPFEARFQRGIAEHGKFVATHLERTSARDHRYLINVVGLLFIAASLPSRPRTDGWLRLAAGALVAEVPRQFLLDGGHGEASTSYHRLVAEAALYGAALLRRLTATGRVAAPPSAIDEALGRITAFTANLLRADGSVPQLGDNDAGRFFKLVPSYERLTVAAAKARFLNLRDYAALPDDAPYWRERPLDHAHLLAAAEGLAGAPGSVEGAVTRSLAGDSKASRLAITPRPEITAGAVRQHAFPNFGLYVYRSDLFTLALRCAPSLKDAAHAHNDQLSLELAVQGRSAIVDPGTYLYTPSPALRNYYRCTAMHNTLVVPGREQNSWAEGQAGLFGLSRRCQARVLTSDDDRWVAEHDGFRDVHRRTVRFLPNRLKVRDECAAPGDKWVALHLHPSVLVLERTSDRVDFIVGKCCVALRSRTDGATWVVEPYRYSSAYGWAEPAVCLRLRHTGLVIDWDLHVEELP